MVRRVGLVGFFGCFVILLFHCGSGIGGGFYGGCFGEFLVIGVFVWLVFPCPQCLANFYYMAMWKG